MRTHVFTVDGCEMFVARLHEVLFASAWVVYRYQKRYEHYKRCGAVDERDPLMAATTRVFDIPQAPDSDFERWGDGRLCKELSLSHTSAAVLAVRVTSIQTYLIWR